MKIGLSKINRVYSWKSLGIRGEDFDGDKECFHEADDTHILINDFYHGAAGLKKNNTQMDDP